MCEDERGPADPVDDVKHGSRVGGKAPTGEGFFPADLLGKGDQAENIVGSSLTQTKGEVAYAIRGNAGLSFNRNLDVSVSSFPHVNGNTLAKVSNAQE